MRTCQALTKALTKYSGSPSLVGLSRVQRAAATEDRERHNGDAFMIPQAGPAELLDHAAADQVTPGPQAVSGQSRAGMVALPRSAIRNGVSMSGVPSPIWTAATPVPVWAISPVSSWMMNVSLPV